MSWRKNESIVPVLMFHSVGTRNDNWIWTDLSEKLDVFENLLSQLSRRGYVTVSLDELYNYMSGNARLPKNSLVLTFDDGYLDNWVFVAPMLRKFGMKGVVYVTPEFVDDSEIVRPSVEDVWSGNLNASELDPIGFMSWAELRRLDTEGTLDVQSHALTHTWYFSDGIVDDIHRPRSVCPYPWLSWNARPDRKPYYMSEDQQSFLPWGYPVFRHEKSLITRRFFPDEAAIAEITGFVQEKGGREYFDDCGWRDDLSGRFEYLAGRERFPGTLESEGRYRERVRHEVLESKQQLEIKLCKKIKYLSWPGGGVNEVAAKLAAAAGYRSCTLSSWQKPDFRNLPGADPSGIKRVSGHSAVYWRGDRIADGGSWWVMRRVLQHQGSLASRLSMRVRKLAWIAGINKKDRARLTSGSSSSSAGHHR